jgi:hypothetical protein
VNRAIQNVPYSEKSKVYPTSQFLLARCQAVPLVVGVNDKITQAIQHLDPAPIWNRAAIERRQSWIAEAAAKVWDLPPAAIPAPTAALSTAAL